MEADNWWTSNITLKWLMCICICIPIPILREQAIFGMSKQVLKYYGKVYVVIHAWTLLFITKKLCLCWPNMVTPVRTSYFCFGLPLYCPSCCGSYFLLSAICLILTFLCLGKIIIYVSNKSWCCRFNKESWCRSLVFAILVWLLVATWRSI